MDYAIDALTMMYARMSCGHNVLYELDVLGLLLSAIPGIKPVLRQPRQEAVRIETKCSAVSAIVRCSILSSATILRLLQITFVSNKCFPRLQEIFQFPAISS